jgi:peptide/nickel transport system substrate-binding protein
MGRARLRRGWVAVFLAATVLAAVYATSSSGSRTAAPTGTLKAVWSGFPSSWEPGSSMVTGYLRVPYENLVDITRTGKIKPRLATKWQLTNSALTLTLRSGVTFHDGTRFDAKAVKTNIEFVRNSPGQFAGPLKVIKTITVLGPNQVRLNLSHPDPALLTTLGGLGVPIASPKALAAGTLKTRPVGTGPWAYDSKGSIPGTKMRFRYYPKYYDPKIVHIGTIELFGLADLTASTNALLTGQVDVATIDFGAAGKVRAAGLGVSAHAEGFESIVFFDVKPGGVFGDVNLRKAVCSAVNPAQIATFLPPGQGVIRKQRFLPGQLGYSPTLHGYPFDLTAAKKYMAAAGNPSVSATIAAFPQIAPVDEGFAAQLRSIGVTLNVQSLQFGDFLSTWNGGKYPIGNSFLFESTPYDLYEGNFAQNAPGNPSHTESAKLKAAAQAAIAAGISPKANALWGNVMKVLYDDDVRLCGQLVINAAIGYHPDRVSNVRGVDFEGSGVDYRAIRLK